MSRETDIMFEMIDIWARQHEFYSAQCTVDSVDQDERTCVVTPTNGGAQVIGVRLEADYTDGATTASKGFFVVPAVGSLVIATFMSKTEAFLSAWTTIDKIVSKQTEWIFNDGSNDGLVIVGDLVTKLNNIESDINDLKTAFAGWVPVPSDGGAALKTALATWYTSPLVPTQQSELENEDVKH
jgi:hypothetical protein